MLRIGVTGGIGCGKSTVASLFAEHFGIPVIDADEVTRELTLPGKPALQAIKDRFGEEVILADGNLNRRRLRQIIFADATAKTKLEAILHPQVRDYIDQWTKSLNTDYCLIVIPLLLESGMRHLVDRILLVDCEPSRQLMRVMRRDQCSEQEVTKIMASQMPREQKRAWADDVIDNNASPEETFAQITPLHNKYYRLATETSP